MEGVAQVLKLMPADTQLHGLNLKVYRFDSTAPLITDVLRLTPTCSRETTIDFRTLSIGNVGFDGFENFPADFFTPDAKLSLDFKQLKANYICTAQKIPEIQSVENRTSNVFTVKDKSA